MCLWCGRTDDRAGGRTVTWLPKFLGCIGNQIFLPMMLRYNDVNDTRVVIGRCPCVLEIRYVDDVTGNLFSLFCSTWRAGLFCLRDYFGLRKLKPWKTFSRSYLQRRKIEKRRQIEVSDNLRMPKLQENFTTQLSSWIIAMRDSLFYKMFSPLFCFEQVKTLKNFSKKLFTNKTKKNKRRARDE